MTKKCVIYARVSTEEQNIDNQVNSLKSFIKLQNEIEELETEQKEWIEKNKKLIASIEVLRTPKRIEKIAQDDLGLEKIDKERIRKVVFE